MAKADLGTKRIDPETGQKFYDLGADPMTSPYTGTQYPRSFFEPPPRAPRSYRGGAQAPVHREVEAEADAEVADVEDDEDSEGASPTDAADRDDSVPEADDVDDSEDVNEIVGSRDDD